MMIESTNRISAVGDGYRRHRTLKIPCLGVGFLTLALAACGTNPARSLDDDTDLTDTSTTDTSTTDTSTTDTSTTDTGPPDVSSDTAPDSGNADAGLCDGPNPAGCVADSDCPADNYCHPTNDECISSSCMCDPDVGWTCTRDCGGGFCTPVVDECVSDSQCEYGAEWCANGVCSPCDNSADTCDGLCDEGFGFPNARNGCTPCSCVPIGGCEGPNPAGCAETGCPDEYACLPADGDQCFPSTCDCGDDGEWWCSDDCSSGSECVPWDTGNCDIDCAVADPVCADNGVTYWCGEFEATCNGVEVIHAGECGTPTGVDCGSAGRCAADELCGVVALGDAPPSYNCSELPDECLDRPTCACVAPEPGTGSDCSDGPDGVTITSYAP